MKSFDVIVIGGGPGGVEAARLAGEAGLRTALIHNAPIGGRATWNSLLPSKSWLQLAETLQKANGHPVLGNVLKTPIKLNHEALRHWIAKSSSDQSSFQKNQLSAAGVSLIEGNAHWSGPGIVEVSKSDQVVTRLSCKNLILSGGSVPIFLPDVKPNKSRIIAPKISPLLNEVPDSMIVMGGGVTGTEYAFAFASLGTSVTILQKNDQLLPSIDAQVIKVFTEYLTHKLPVSVHTGTTVDSVEQVNDKVIVKSNQGQTFSAAYGFIAISRKADLSFFKGNIPDGLEVSGSFINVNRWSETTIPDFYAIGDITGPPMMANRAKSQAREAVRAILGQKDETPLPVTMEAIYTQPNVVQLGNMCVTPDSFVKTLNWEGNLKAAMNNYTEGILRIHIQKNTELILGASAFGNHATEVLSVLELAINERIPWPKVVRTPYAHPSLSEVLT